MIDETGTGLERIKRDPLFHELVRKRTTFAWILSLLMLLIYFGFVATVAFYKEILGQPLSSSGVTTVGIPVGIGVIVSAFLLTGLYVWRANSAFDEITRKLIEKVQK
jgi:uncharacterized membrane protein (DUF485 family)